MGLSHRGVEFVAETEVQRQPRRRSPIILSIESQGVVIEVAPFHSALNGPKLKRRLILQKAGQAAAKVHPAAIENRLSNDPVDLVAEESKFQGMLPPRIDKVIAQAADILQVIVGAGRVRTQGRDLPGSTIPRRANHEESHGRPRAYKRYVCGGHSWIRNDVVGRDVCPAVRNAD